MRASRVSRRRFAGVLGRYRGHGPDAEHAMLLAGLIEQDDEIFPTHGGENALHGRETHEYWSQLLIAAAAMAVVAINDRKSDG